MITKARKKDTKTQTIENIYGIFFFMALLSLQWIVSKKSLLSFHYSFLILWGIFSWAILNAAITKMSSII